MSEFMVRTSNLLQIGQQQEEIKEDLERIEIKINEVLNNLQVNSSATIQIKNALRTNLSNVSSIKGKLRVLSDALEDISRLYEQTENKLTGNASSSENIKEHINDVAREIRETAAKCGMDVASVYSSDPVNLCNGNYVYEKTYLELDTESQLQFRIFYNIQNSAEGVIGRGWSHTWEMAVLNEKERIVVRKDDASQLIFYKQEGFLVPASGTLASLLETESGYVLNERSQMWYYFDISGRLVRKENESHNCTSLIYDEMGKLIMVKDDYNNFLKFAYRQNGELNFVEDHGGRRIELDYQDSILSSVQDAQGRTIEYHYDEKYS